MVYLAVMEKRKGKSIDEVRDWAEKTKGHICHWFTVDDLNHLKRGGRISAATALVGTLPADQAGAARGRRRSSDQRFQSEGEKYVPGSAGKPDGGNRDSAWGTGHIYQPRGLRRRRTDRRGNDSGSIWREDVCDQLCRPGHRSTFRPGNRRAVFCGFQTVKVVKRGMKKNKGNPVPLVRSLRSPPCGAGRGDRSKK